MFFLIRQDGMRSRHPPILVWLYHLLCQAVSNPTLSYTLQGYSPPPLSVYDCVVSPLVVTLIGPSHLSLISLPSNPWITNFAGLTIIDASSYAKLEDVSYQLQGSSCFVWGGDFFGPKNRWKKDNIEEHSSQFWCFGVWVAHRLIIIKYEILLSLSMGSNHKVGAASNLQ